MHQRGFTVDGSQRRRLEFLGGLKVIPLHPDNSQLGEHVRVEDQGFPQ